MPTLSKPRYAKGVVIDKLLESPKLTTKQQRFAELLSAGVPYGEAANQAGYKGKASAYYALKHPLVQRYISSIRAESRAIAVYDITRAMEEAQEAKDFAREKGNAMAYCKAVELRAKLSGLLIDRVEIATVDLTGALSRAEQRVLSVAPQPVAVDTPTPNASCPITP